MLISYRYYSTAFYGRSRSPDIELLIAKFKEIELTHINNLNSTQISFNSNAPYCNIFIPSEQVKIILLKYLVYSIIFYHSVHITFLSSPVVPKLIATFPTHVFLLATFQEPQEFLQISGFYHISYSSLPDNPVVTH